MVDMQLESMLKDFGLDEKEVQVYLGLSKHGTTTVLELSRHLPIKRATLYRVLESLKDKGLVETQVDDKTTYYSPSDPQQFESLVLEQEEKTTRLKASLRELASNLNIIASGKTGETTVRFFRGKAGLKQMEWRMCEGAKNSEICIIGTSQWYEVLGRDFAESIRETIVQNNIAVYELIENGEPEKIPPNGNATFTHNQAYIRRHFRHRELPRHILRLTQDLYIYRDFIQFHGYREGDVMGIEIQSKDFAEMFRQIFWHYWKEAKIIDRFGSLIKT